ncbi:hypothetical protein [Aromatoleum bremense]|uniref:Uncharacterized protein n=1 Tax=Aromatoleum bremense TaxID=76115 RepID=A0ABX1NXD6_9RHOO|nr:hypothetical protein [Aromatoleum bremense]NMG16684.1 hypothetical protein [Aromatoleum bremense]QTQ33838.1 Uncharacterized protein pbN1_38530 [Aromatoleum bremense]
MASCVERILILAKTSAQYVETSCVAGINEHGAMRRLFPVLFRLVKREQQFKKWGSGRLGVLVERALLPPPPPARPSASIEPGHRRHWTKSMGTASRSG